MCCGVLRLKENWREVEGELGEVEGAMKKTWYILNEEK